MIALHASFITRKDMDTVLGCLVTDSIGPGEYTEKLIKNGKDIFKYDAAVALRSPYTALQLAVAQLGLSTHARIGISALAPMYHSMAIEALGHEAVFYDHDPEYGNISDDSNLKACDAAVLFSPFGIPVNVAFAQALGIPTIEDITHSLGSLGQEAENGCIGSLGIYAMEQGALVTAGGGALLFASSRKTSPIVRNLAERISPETAMTDYNAALGLAKIRDFPDILERRRALAEMFRGETARTRHKVLGGMEEFARGLTGFPILLESSMKDAVIHAKRNGVETAPAFESSIVSQDGFPENQCKGAKSLALRCLQFPLHEKISAKDANLIKKVIATLP